MDQAANKMPASGGPDEKIEFLVRDEPHVRLTAGDVVFRAGDDGDRMYVVRDGRVEIVVEDQVVEILEQGHCFGEMAMFDRMPRSATARAVSDCELVTVSPRRFDSLFTEKPGFAKRIMHIIASRLRRSNLRLGGRSDGVA